jgi:hypothetical protein
MSNKLIPFYCELLPIYFTGHIVAKDLSNFPHPDAKFWNVTRSKGGKNRFLELSTSIGFFKQSVEAGNRVGIGLPYRPARLQRLVQLILGIDSWAP